MRRIDSEGRDVTGLDGLHDDSDRFISDAEYQAGCVEMKGDEYYKAKIQELAAWLASQEAVADAAERQASEDRQPLRQTHQAGKASMAFRTRRWILENIKGMK